MQREHLEILHDMFQSNGWAILETQLKELDQKLDSVVNVNDEKELFIAKGRLLSIRECLSMPELVKAALDAEDLPEADNEDSV